MFKNVKASDVAVLMLTITVCAILIMSAYAIMTNQSDGKIEEIIAFILGSITTIIGEYILLNLKRNNKPEDIKKKD